ncbi:MAG TPA: putative quinol monooxygenase [Alphaproteobacteria bacterium]|nr:putative quinol monooxygenase [Alphaproteobacteria bacterium]
MTIGMIVKIKVKAGKNAEFENGFKEAQAGVRAEEPGCLYYDLYQSPSDAQTYFVLERYTGQPAVDQHVKTKHFAKMMQAGPGLMDGAPEVQNLKLVNALR